jgi:hypothetical protein
MPQTRSYTDVELAAHVPNLLGFHPVDDRLVAVFFNQYTLLCVGNSTLADAPKSLKKWSREAIGATSVSLLAYAQHPTTDELTRLAEATGSVHVGTVGVVRDGDYIPFHDGVFLTPRPIPTSSMPSPHIASTAEISVELSAVSNAAAVAAHIEGLGSPATRQHKTAIDTWLKLCAASNVMRPRDEPSDEQIAALLLALSVNPRLSRWNKTDTPVSRLMRALAATPADALPALMTWLRYAYVRAGDTDSSPIASALAAAYYISGDSRRCKWVLVHSAPTRYSRVLSGLVGVEGSWAAPPNRVRTLLMSFH